MVEVSAQLSIYPLRQTQLSPTIDEAVRICRAHGLEVHTGPMSTLLSGDDEAVFTALKDALRDAASRGEFAMIVALSNTCPRWQTSNRPATPS